MANCLDRDLVEIEDVVNEGNKPGSAEPYDILDEAGTTAVLASIAKTVDQPADVITDKGLGTYGLTLDKMQEAGVVKKGLNTSGTLESILQDPSVYTGCGSIRKVDDLTGNESKQRAVVITASNKTIRRLVQQGVLTGEESQDQLAKAAGLARKFSAEDIKKYVESSDSQEDSGLSLSDFAEMGAIATAAVHAVELISKKAGGLLEKVKGLGASVSSLPEKAKGTVKTVDLDEEVDKFIGSKRIPSAVNPDEIEDEFSKAASALNVEDLF